MDPRVCPCPVTHNASGSGPHSTACIPLRWGARPQEGGLPGTSLARLRFRHGPLLQALAGRALPLARGPPPCPSNRHPPDPHDSRPCQFLSMGFGDSVTSKPPPFGGFFGSWLARLDPPVVLGVRRNKRTPRVGRESIGLSTALRGPSNECGGPCPMKGWGRGWKGVPWGHSQRPAGGTPRCWCGRMPRRGYGPRGSRPPSPTASPTQPSATACPARPAPRGAFPLPPLPMDAAPRSLHN